MITIDDPDDPRIEPYRSVRERDIAGRGERFIVEGEVVLGVLVGRSPFPVESLLLAENRIGALADLVGTLLPHVPVYSASRRVMDAIVGFPIHRGVLAVALRSGGRPAAEILAQSPPDAVVIGLLGLANHDNVGGIFRNAAAFGAAAVLLDNESCDPLYRKAIRVSVGGSLIVPFARGGDGDTMSAHLANAGFDVLSLSPSGITNLRDLRVSGRTALLLGAEGPGLPPALLARTKTVSIAMAGGFDSLNVATTSGIALYELSRSRAGHTLP